MTASAPGARWTTQASNFSWRRRSTDAAEVATVSMPNWRKHSDSKARDDSLRSTRAARAATFLVETVDARALPKAFSMGSGPISSTKVILPCRGGDGKNPKGQGAGVLKGQYRGVDWRVQKARQRPNTAPGNLLIS